MQLPNLIGLMCNCRFSRYLWVKQNSPRTLFNPLVVKNGALGEKNNHLVFKLNLYALDLRFFFSVQIIGLGSFFTFNVVLF